MRYYILSVFLIAYLFSNAQVTTVPASPYPVEVIQPDGSTLDIYASGDENNHISITEDGFTVVKNRKGFYEYARKASSGKLVPSGIIANGIGKRSFREELYLSSIARQITPDYTIIQEPVLKSSTIVEKFPTSGSQQKVLLLMIKYPDLDPTYTPGEFHSMMNDVNYNGTGSFNDYYVLNSDGNLSLDVDVLGWYTAAHNYLYYADDNGYNVSRELVREAVDAAEAAGVDFSQYDNDNNGYVDELMVVHSGPGAEEGSRSAEYIWSHSSSLGGSYYRYYDGVYINRYVIQPETRIYTSGMVGIGVFCHEFGHALGLPDLYDTDDSSEGIGRWGLMASGAWLNYERTPAMLTSWCREELGWVSPTVIPYPITAAEEGAYSLQPAATSTEVYKILTQNSNEYFLLENTYQTGNNTYLPGSGLAIYHINTNQSGNSNEALKLVDLEEADGDDDLDNNTNRGDSGDVYPGSSNNHVFDDLSYPNSKTYDLQTTGVNISDIQMSGSTAQFTLVSTAAASPNLTYNPAMDSYSVNGSNISIGLQVQNTGDGDAGAFRIGYYLSSNSFITTADYLITSDYVSGLNSGASENHNLSLDVNTLTGLAEGDYFMGYIIDYQGDVEETTESDNTSSYLSETVHYGPVTNLTFVGGSNSLSVNGSQVNISMEVINDGDVATDACRVGYYLSDNANITTADYFLGYDIVAALNPGETSPENISVDVEQTLPGLPEGSYYAGYLIDYAEVVAEDDETDNDYAFLTPNYMSCQPVQTLVEEEICQGDSILFNGDYYKNEGSYPVVLSNQYGCDSTVTLNLTVHETNTTELNEFICPGDSIVVGSESFKESGVFERILNNQFGCDSVVTLNLTVYPVTDTIIEASVCEGDFYTIGVKQYNTTGVYSDTLVNQFGCDSVIFLDLIVHPVNHTNLIRTICEGDSVEVGNSVYKSEGVYTNYLENKYGCDSIVELELYVNPVYEIPVIAEICEGEEYSVGDQVFNSTGQYSVSFSNQFGCDSTILLDLTVHQHDNTNFTRTICEGDSVKVGNSVYKTAGVYTDNLENQYGCDSIVELELIVNPVQEVPVVAEICEGDEYQVGDQVFDSNGQYSVTLTNQYGCDSTILLDLTVHPVHFTLLEETICEGGSVVIGDSVYSETGNYTNYFKNSFGCDSIVSLNLTVNPFNYTNLSETICEGDSVVIGNSTYKIGGIYIDTFSNRFGCDSVVTLDLTVNPIHETAVNAEVCNGDSYFIGGFEFNEAGSYPVVLTNQFGCDSVVTVNLEILPTHDTLIVAEICQGESYEVGGLNYTQTGVFKDTLENSFGCDSVVTLDLKVLPVSDTLLEKEICQGDSVVVGTSVYKSSGSYTDVFTNRFGCDSIVHLNLIVHPSYDTLLVKNICEGDSILLGDVSYKTTGVYNKLFASVFGCDSLVTLDLTVNPVQDTTVDIELCQREFYMLGDRKLFVAGTYQEVLTSNAGCDSAVTVNLSFKPIYFINQNRPICEGDSVVVGSSVYKTDGVYIDTLISQYNCDSIITTSVFINPVSDTVLFKEICEGENFQVGNETYSEAGTYFITLSNQFGCDSLITLNLDVNPSDQVLITHSMCEGEEFTFDGEVLTSSGIYTLTVPNKFGCDSVTTLDLTVNMVSQTGLDIEICKGESYEMGGVEYSESGTYEETFANQFGCDSVVTLNLVVHQPDEVAVFESMCQGQSVFFGGTEYSEEGVYTHTFDNKFGCDSVVTLDLTVNPVSDTLLDLNIFIGDSVVIGNSVYDTTGIYTEILTNRFGCDSLIILDLYVNDTIQSVNPIQDLASGMKVALYPNPADNYVNIEISDVRGGYRLKIISSDGRILYSGEGEIYTNMHIERVGLNRFTDGIYSVVVESESKRVTKQLIIR